jgi:DNA-binding NarL/FixJ family response regulator
MVDSASRVGHGEMPDVGRSSVGRSSRFRPELETVMPVRILIVDDHPVVRHGLKNLLEGHPGWEVIDEAEDGVEAVEKATELRPDVVVIDITMPRMNGLEACKRIREAVPECEILVVTQHDSPQMIREAMGAGAKGYVVKSNAARDLLAAVEAVSQHTVFAALGRHLSLDRG